MKNFVLFPILRDLLWQKKAIIIQNKVTWKRSWLNGIYVRRDCDGSPLIDVLYLLQNPYYYQSVLYYIPLYRLAFIFTRFLPRKKTLLPNLYYYIHNIRKLKRKRKNPSRSLAKSWLQTCDEKLTFCCICFLISR